MATYSTRVTRFVPGKAYSRSVIQKNIHRKVDQTLLRIVDDVDAVVMAAAYKSMNMLAPKVVYSIAQGRGFNSYTGALAYAYGASLVLDGQHIGNYIMDDGALIDITPPPATIRFSSKRHRPYAVLQGRRKHLNVSRYRRRPYTYKRKGGRPTKYFYKKYLRTRFLQRYESITGYNKGLFKKNLSPAANYIPYKKRNGNKFSRLFYLQVFNVAPYAPIVQKMGYEVIDGGRIRGRARYVKRVVADVSTKMIERAIHNYKKDYSRMQSGRYSGPLGRTYRPGREEWD